jgi:hypothetical protein
VRLVLEKTLDDKRRLLIYQGESHLWQVRAEELLNRVGVKFACSERSVKFACFERSLYSEVMKSKIKRQRSNLFVVSGIQVPDKITLFDLITDIHAVYITTTTSPLLYHPPPPVL